jgi:hypothetical protein
MLKALGDGETNPAVLAAMADKKLRATQTQLCDALGACTELNAVYRRLLKMTLEELQLLEQQVGQLDQGMASLLSQHQDSVKRVAEMPAWASTQSSRSSPKWVRRQRRFLPPSSSSPGLVHALEMKKAEECPRATARRRAIATCGGFSNNLPMLQLRLKEASSRLFIAVWCRAWDTNKPSEPLPIGFVG